MPDTGVTKHGESRWGAAVATLAVIALHVVLPVRLSPGPRWLVPALEVALLLAVLATNPTRITRESRDARVLSLVLIGVIAAANAVALGQIVRLLLVGGVGSGRELVGTAVGVWLTNMVVFGLWFWEIDRGGPHARSLGRSLSPDFLFPQESMPVQGWLPTFVDYLYVSFTNSTAFSPTDAMPLTPRVKLGMLVQALFSVVTLGLVLARAVNILA